MPGAPLPPEEDIAATLVHAENQSLPATMRALAARSRPRRGATAVRVEFPVPSPIFTGAGSRVASHLGEGRDFEQSTWGIKRAIKAGLPDDDARLIAR